MPKTNNKPYDPNEPVTLRLFKDNDRYKDDVFVCVNGDACLIRRGETVTIKRKFADLLERSMAQDGKTADMMGRHTEQFLQNRV